MPIAKYDWNAAAEQAQAERLPNGYHLARIVRILVRRGSGEAFTSRDGDPQIMLIFADDNEREAAQMFTLSEKAAWTLARLMSRFGIDLDDVKRQGIEPSHFADKKFAESWLLKRSGWVKVEWRPSVNGREFSEVVPYHVHELPDEEVASEVEKSERRPRQRVPELTADEIPF